MDNWNQPQASPKREIYRSEDDEEIVTRSVYFEEEPDSSDLDRQNNNKRSRSPRSSSESVEHIPDFLTEFDDRKDAKRRKIDRETAK